LSKERSASELFKHYMQLENTLELKKKMEREQELLAAWRQGYRCHNPNSADFRNYGQRGITVCDRWLVFENFLEDMGTAPAGTSLDRKDNTKGYYKRNCRWATSKQQANNKRTSNRIRFRGKTQTVAQWAEEIGMNYKTLWSRLSKGVPMSQAIKSSK